jgi:hypothetical protein
MPGPPGVPGSWLVAGPVDSLEELFSRGGQDNLPVRDRDQAELRIKLATALQVDQQLAARTDIRTPVSERVGHLELVAEPVDEIP